MRGKRLSIGLRSVLAILTMTLFVAGTWAVAQETVLYKFCSLNDCPDGASPVASLIFDVAGNLYGTTAGGGAYTGENCDPTYYLGCGVVFELTPQAGGSWTETVLHSFSNQGTGGATPIAGLVFDQAGKLYGMTGGGGAYGYGTVFELTPTQGEGWTETVLHQFGSLTDDGSYPFSGLIFDAAGNLYGTTSAGGTGNCYDPIGCGTVFELTPTSGGGWTEKVLHSFNNNGTDGYGPAAGLVFDKNGNLYGTTTAGGTSTSCFGGCGTVFELTPQAGGGWTEQVLYDFHSTDGAFPYSSLIFDAAGNLYGTTAAGGSYGSFDGTVFELTPQAGGAWTETVLHSFGSGTDGFSPSAGLIFDAAGNLYGTTYLGGAYGYGTVFELTSQAGGAWTETVLHSFGSGTDGFELGASLIFDATGNLYSTTTAGGNYILGASYGTVFELQVPPTLTVSPIGSGTITSTDGFINCPGSCTHTYPRNTQVTLNATPSEGWVFGGWNGGCLGTGSCIVTVTQPLSVDGIFSQALQLVTVTPCRVVDTRQASGTFGGPAITGGTSRSFPIPQGACNIPASAAAYSLNVTVVPNGALGYLTIWPTGENQPVVSTLNSPDGRVKANAAIVPAGTSGAVSVYVSNTTNVILDIDGYFAPPGSQTYQFYPLPPCRIVDTRSGDGGILHAGVERDYTIPPNCGVPSTATAYSFNVTVLPSAGGLDYLTVWPKGESQPVVSTLNDNTGTVVANAAVVPAGSENATAFYAHSNSTNLLLDVDGYFAAPGQTGLSLYPVAPCRVLDTRQNNGQPFMGDWNPPNGVDVLTSQCAPPSTAAAYVFNATVVPPASMPYLTLWPHGEGQPGVSTLNAYDGFITSNMAIVPTNDGSIDAYAAGLTQLILDISGYFAP